MTSGSVPCTRAKTHRPGGAVDPPCSDTAERASAVALHGSLGPRSVGHGIVAPSSSSGSHLSRSLPHVLLCGLPIGVRLDGGEVLRFDFQTCRFEQGRAVVNRQHFYAGAAIWSAGRNPAMSNDSIQPRKVFSLGPVTRCATDGAKQINARAEGIAKRQTFKPSFKRKRCLIPADGFYEWQKFEEDPKRSWQLLRMNSVIRWPRFATRCRSSRCPTSMRARSSGHGR